jgi:hypothetical protein
VDAKKASQLLKVRQKLGEKVEHLIRHKGYPSLENFALANGFHKSTVHQVVRATVDPRFSTLYRISEALEISFEDLIKGLR